MLALIGARGEMETVPLLAAPRPSSSALRVFLVATSAALLVAGALWQTTGSDPATAALEAQDDAITVACLGASITWGLCSSDPHTRSWPAVLQGLLDDKYGDGTFRVLNYGSCGRVMTLGHFWSYENSTEWTLALESGADIVAIDLGGDDADVVVGWDEDKFRYSYRRMISQLRALPSEPEILPFSELPFHHIRQDNNEFVGSLADITEIRNHELPKIVAEIAADEGISKVFDEWAFFGGARKDSTQDDPAPEHESSNKAWYCPSIAYGDLHPNDVRPNLERATRSSRLTARARASPLPARVFRTATTISQRPCGRTSRTSPIPSGSAARGLAADACVSKRTKLMFAFQHSRAPVGGKVRDMRNAMAPLTSQSCA